MNAPGLDQQPLSFGIFDWLDDNKRGLADLYDQRLRMVEYADRAGFFGYHIAEHHGTPLGLAPSPALFLAAAAQRTRTIRLGPLVYLLPLYNPVRLIEEICMLDHLSHGRLELGVGRGISPFELGVYNVDSAESRDIFREALEIIIAGLSTGTISHQGRYFSFNDVQVPLRPYQRPYPPLWYPTGTPESIAWVAEHGISTVNHYSPLPVIKEQFDLCRRMWEEGRDNPQRLNGHVRNPKLGIMRHVYVADTDAKALKEAKEAFVHHFGSFNYLWALHGSDRHAHLADFDVTLAKGLHFVGSPATVRRQIQEQVEITGCNYIVGAFAFGNLSDEQVMNSTRLFAEEVMPAFAVQPAKEAAP